MGVVNNEGYDPAIIKAFRMKLAEAKSNYLFEDPDENTDEYVHFRFIGKYKSREVIYDAAIFTLRLNHESDLYEIAEQRAAEHFPAYKKIAYDEDDNGSLQPPDPQEEEIGLFMAEVILELEEEESVKVKEHIEIDASADFGVCLDVGLHVEKITPKIIEKFIREFNQDALTLDDTLYSFQTQDEED